MRNNNAMRYLAKSIIYNFCGSMLNNFGASHTALHVSLFSANLFLKCFEVYRENDRGADSNAFIKISHWLAIIDLARAILQNDKPASALLCFQVSITTLNFAHYCYHTNFFRRAPLAPVVHTVTVHQAAAEVPAAT